jgi:alanine dehydrogenase
MKIGVPKEIKTQEYRVGLTPESVMELTRAGHDVFVQTSAGLGLGASDADYVEYIGGRKTFDGSREVIGFVSNGMVIC